MAKPNQKNIVEKLTGVGEEAMQRLGVSPGAEKVIAAFAALPKRVDELQKSVRGLEKLEKRLGTIEKRLDKLEGKGSSGTRKTTSAKRSAATRKPSSGDSTSSSDRTWNRFTGSCIQPSVASVSARPAAAGTAVRTAAPLR